MSEEVPRKRARLGIYVQPECHDGLRRLPRDVWLILRDLVPSSIVSLACSCKWLLALAKSPSFWHGYAPPELDLSNPDHINLIEGLRIGRYKTLAGVRVAQDRLGEGAMGTALNLLGGLHVHNLFVYSQHAPDWRMQELLSKPASIRELSFKICQGFTGSALSALLSPTSLTFLRFDTCLDLTDSKLSVLRALERLEVLIVKRCFQLACTGLQHLRGIETLRRLELVHCRRIDNETTGYLRMLCQLEELRLEATPASIRLDWLSELTRLKRLNLTGCLGFTDADISQLSNLSFLRELDLTYCMNIQSVGFLGLFNLKLESLKITISSSHLSGGLTLRDLARLPALVELGFWECPQLTCADLCSALSGNPSLRRLTFCDCNGLRGLATLGGLRALRELALFRCQDIPAEAVLSLRQARNDLQVHIR